jgi:hypothetical protein
MSLDVSSVIRALPLLAAAQAVLLGPAESAIGHSAGCHPPVQAVWKRQQRPAGGGALNSQKCISTKLPRSRFFVPAASQRAVTSHQRTAKTQKRKKKLALGVVVGGGGQETPSGNKKRGWGGYEMRWWPR